MSLVFTLPVFSENTPVSKNSILSRCTAYFEAGMMTVKKAFSKEKTIRVEDPLIGQFRIVRRQDDGSYKLDRPSKQAIHVQHPLTDETVIAELGADGLYKLDHPFEIFKEKTILVEDPSTRKRVKAERQDGDIFKLRDSLQETTIFVKNPETNEIVIAERQDGQLTKGVLFTLDRPFTEAVIRFRDPETGEMEIRTAELSTDGSYYELQELSPEKADDSSK